MAEYSNYYWAALQAGSGPTLSVVGQGREFKSLGLTMVGKETDDLLLPSSLLPSSLLPSSLLQQLVFCTYSLTIFNHCGELII